jgi:ABC-type enterochelin transport system substrate-binding protein
LATRIDGAGLAKLETLENAVTQVQRLNTIVERMAQAQRMQQPLMQFRQQIQRAAAPVASLLKPQFEPISSMVTNLVLVSTRGGTDANKVRSLRESVAQIRVQLEAAESIVRKQHTVDTADTADPADDEAKGPATS